MRFSFFHLMPYGAVDLEAITNTAWIVFSNSNYLYIFDTFIE